MTIFLGRMAVGCPPLPIRSVHCMGRRSPPSLRRLRGNLVPCIRIQEAPDEVAPAAEMSLRDHLTNHGSLCRPLSSGRASRLGTSCRRGGRTLRCQLPKQSRSRRPSDCRSACGVTLRGV